MMAALNWLIWSLGLAVFMMFGLMFCFLGLFIVVKLFRAISSRSRMHRLLGLMFQNLHEAGK